MKNIRDSVHGNIIVDTKFIKTILDTPAFQRLRRVEQTAIRSIYPSARHDRFIHSLGVYHIGSLIVNHMRSEFHQWKEVNNKPHYEGYDDQTIETIFNSYLVACLLHDIAHAPFSHTFESYYGNRPDLFDILNKELEGNLQDELKKLDDPNFHEYASAIAVVRIYGKDVIEKQLGADIELVCRMIIGCFYKREKDTYQLHNCFISLIHGDVVDADRMDYACRDVWASGYCTSSIDIMRIVSALHIKRSKEKNELNICFDCNALNEISNMLDVRHFQNRYVINHHSVQYEQKLLVLAAEQAAYNIWKEISEERKGQGEQELRDDISTTKALEHIVSLDACIGSIPLSRGRQITRISDEDLLSLIKGDIGNPYYEEYASRQYKRIAVWKTPDEFFHYFPDLLRGVDLYNPKFEDEVKQCLKERMGISDIIICKVKYKPTVNLKSLYIVVNGDIIRYTDIHPELKIDLSDTEKDINFYYIYVPFSPGISTDDLRKYRSDIVGNLTPLLRSLYPQTQEDAMYEKLQMLIDRSYKLINENREKQISNMSDDITSLQDFLKGSGLSGFLENYPNE